jgi:hypothetical protein
VRTLITATLLSPIIVITIRVTPLSSGYAVGVNIANLKKWLREQGAAYRHGADRPLAGYLALLATYVTGVGATTVAARAAGKRPPAGISPWDLAQLSLATHRIARTITKDPVTSPLRAPFAEYEETSGPAELTEQVRGHGLRHSAGELMTCPFCIAQWVATGLTAGLVLAPRATRLVTATFSAVALADFLQYGYSAAQQAVE